MINNAIRIACFLLFSIATYGQGFTEHTLEGKVSSADGDVSATHVLNISTKKAAITDIDGFFSISVSVYDTLVFSAIQYKKKELVISPEIMASKMIYVTLEASLTELNEVVVMPFSLSGELARDMNSMEVETPITAAALGLPNAFVKKMTQADRKLYASQAGGPLINVLNSITGETKRLRLVAERQRQYVRTERIRRVYHDSLYIKQLKIPKEKIDDFMYFCEIDSSFAAVDENDALKVWEILRAKSIAYRKNNELDTP